MQNATLWIIQNLQLYNYWEIFINKWRTKIGYFIHANTYNLTIWTIIEIKIIKKKFSIFLISNRTDNPRLLSRLLKGNWKSPDNMSCYFFAEHMVEKCKNNVIFVFVFMDFLINDEWLQTWENSRFRDPGSWKLFCKLRKIVEKSCVFSVRRNQFIKILKCGSSSFDIHS